MLSKLFENLEFCIFLLYSLPLTNVNCQEEEITYTVYYTRTSYYKMGQNFVVEQSQLEIIDVFQIKSCYLFSENIALVFYCL